MNDLLVKLEDFQLDEISGGITAKQIGKKAGAYAIKGLCTVTFAIVDSAGAVWNYKNKKLSNLCILALPFLGVTGWKIGELICKKIGLED